MTCWKSVSSPVVADAGNHKIHAAANGVSMFLSLFFIDDVVLKWFEDKIKQIHGDIQEMFLLSLTGNQSCETDGADTYSFRDDLPLRMKI